MVLAVKGEEGDWTRMHSHCAKSDLREVLMLFSLCFWVFLLCQAFRALQRGRRHNPGTSENRESLWAPLSQFAAPDLPVWVLRVLGERHHMYASGQTPPPMLQFVYANVSYLRLRIPRLSFSVPPGRHWHLLVRRPLGFAGRQSLRDLLSWGKGWFKAALARWSIRKF